jgi:hypothetical protein
LKIKKIKLNVLFRTPSKLSEHADESTITSVSEKHIETPSKSSICSSPPKNNEVNKRKILNLFEIVFLL